MSESDEIYQFLGSTENAINRDDLRKEPEEQDTAYDSKKVLEVIRKAAREGEFYPDPIRVDFMRSSWKEPLCFLMD